MLTSVQNADYFKHIVTFQQGNLYFNEKVNVMNKDQVKGAIKNFEGKVQEDAGKLVGSKEQQIKGMSKQVAGKTEQKYGDAKETLKHKKS